MIQNYGDPSQNKKFTELKVQAVAKPSHKEQIPQKKGIMSSSKMAPNVGSRSKSNGVSKY